ncbi:MAG TPA: SpoIIE family protein phosphatase [Roseiflexaceae bacterium]|nr:SpoIIE family protein phosphatase [Roseiflexaceae bacterium]
MDVALLKHVPLFGSLPLGELADMAASLHERRYPAGAVLFREGDYGDRFYIVLDGQIEIVKALGTDDERTLGLRGAGEFVGEMSLLSQDGLRTASVRVHDDARVLELTRADFDALLHRHPLLAYEMLRVQSLRLRESHDTAIRDLHEKNARLAQAYADLQAAQARIIEQQTLERELRLARETQESMLPRALPRLAGFDIGARMIAAHMIGGDFFDLFLLSADSLAVVIGDVSGKGMPAALFMALVSSLLRAEAPRSDTPEQALRVVNRHLLNRDARGMFVTVLYGVLRQKTREFSYVRAGHEQPLLLDADDGTMTPEMGRGHPLGLFPNPVLDAQTISMPPGGTLLLYTDGVPEAMDARDELFGTERIVAAIRAVGEASAQELCDRLVQSVTDHHGSPAHADDITLLAVRAR